MFYEEMMIDGEWHYRTTPDGAWRKGRKSAKNPDPISVERLREIAHWLRRFSDDGQHKRIHGPSAGQAYEAGVEIDGITSALLHQLAEMSADLEREQGVREDAQRQLRAAKRAREEACGLLRKAWRILDIDAPNDKTTDDIAAFLAASGANDEN